MATKQEKLAAIYLLICYVVNVHYSSNIYCPEAVKSMKVVESCPMTEEERDKASELKKCTQLSQEQNCSDPLKFRYHCVINELRNQRLEVCAPTQYMLGYCPEFNIKGGIIQNHYLLECSKFDPPCAMRYLSTEAYLYKACFDLIKSSPDLDEVSSTSSDVIYFLYITAPVLVAIILAVVVCYFKRHKQWVPCVRNDSTRLAGNEERNQEILTMLKDEIATGGGRFKDDEGKKSISISIAMNGDKVTDGDMSSDSEYGDMSSDDKSSISTDSYTDLTAVNRGKYLLKMSFEGNEGNTSKTNERKTMQYLESFKTFDKYFVETKLLRHVKKILQTESIAILIGSPGCGKTNTVVHLMLDKTYITWKKHMIHSWEDLRFLKSKKDSLVLIDNIFDGYMYNQQLDRWWDVLYNIFYKFIQKSEKGFVSKPGGKVKLLITAKENIIEKVCAYMSKPLPIFKSSCIVYTKTMELADEEKDDIFEMQMKYAKDVKGIEPPVENMNENSKFRTEIRKSNGPIGFPLCAHLFACNQNYRPMGSHFFSSPITYLQTQIRHEISSDISQRTKTLFLILFLNELKNRLTNGNESVDLVEEECERFIKNLKFLPDGFEQLQPLDFSELVDVAIHYTGTLLSGTEKSTSYRFKHNAIYDAVGDYFIKEHFDYTVKVFPLDVLESREFPMCEETQCDALISRFISEVDSRNISKVFACKALNRQIHAERFCGYLKNKKKSFITKFLATTDEPSGFPLPPVFWISKNKLSILTALIFEVMEEKQIDTNLHIYFSLFGDICAEDENLLKLSQEKISQNMKNTKDVVLNYETPDGNSILHLVVKSEKSDFQTAYTVEMLNTYANQDQTRVKKINKANSNGELPITTAAKHYKNGRVLTCLALIEDRLENVQKTDHNGFSVIHHAVSGLVTEGYNKVLELEVMVRLAIFMTYRVNPDLQNNENQRAVDMCKNSSYEHVRELLYCGMTSQREMAILIEEEISRIKIQYEIDERLKISNPRNMIGQELMQAIRKSISILCRKDIAVHLENIS